MTTEDINLLSIYEPKIDKAKLTDKIKNALDLYNSATGKDKEQIAINLIIYAKTLEEGFKVGYTGMTDLYDEKCDLEEELIETKKKLQTTLEFIKQQHSTNPEILEKFNNMNTVFVPNNKGKRDYNEMINKYILKAKNLKK